MNLLKLFAALIPAMYTRAMRWLTTAMLALGVAGCFDPSIRPGGSCANGRACPPGQVCSLESICELPGLTGVRDAGEQPDASDSDASFSMIDEETDPVKLLGNNCSLPDPSVSKTVAVDDQDRIHLAAICNGEISVAVSVTGGRSFSPFTAVGLSDGSPSSSVAMSASAENVLLASVVGNQILVVRSSDGGNSWSDPASAGQAESSFSGLSMARGENVTLIIARSAGGQRVARSEDQGQTWSSTMVLSQAAYADVVTGEDENIFYIIGDEPEILAQRSTNGGLTFSPEIVIEDAALQFSDFAAHDHQIVGVGIDQNALVINSQDLNVLELPTNLPSVVPRGRSVQVLAEGLTYILSSRSAKGVELLRIDEVQASSRAIDPTGERGSFFAVRDGVVVILFEKEQALYSTVKLF